MNMNYKSENWYIKNNCLVVDYITFNGKSGKKIFDDISLSKHGFYFRETDSKYYIGAVTYNNLTTSWTALYNTTKFTFFVELDLTHFIKSARKFDISNNVITTQLKLSNIFENYYIFLSRLKLIGRYNKFWVNLNKPDLIKKILLEFSTSGKFANIFDGYSDSETINIMRLIKEDINLIYKNLI